MAAVSKSRRFRFQPDRFTLLLAVAVLLAVLIPIGETGQSVLQVFGFGAVSLLFFLHGVKLAPQNLWAGLTHWRLQLLILFSTFVVFPLLGLLLRAPITALAGSQLYLGFLFLCLLPSTVQTSIAFTSIAGGNVAAAVCAASTSSLLGILITPLLTGLLLNLHGGVSSQMFWDICRQILLPFGLGQLSRPWLASLVQRYRPLVGIVDQGSILIIVFAAFSAGMRHKLWSGMTLFDFLALILVSAVMLTLIMLFTSRSSRLLGFNREDRLAIFFCGSKKSLSVGVSMAGILFPAVLAGQMILPLMFFHQLQLIVCAHIAGRAKASLESTARTAERPATV